MATRNVALNIILGSVNNMRPGLQSANAQVAKLKETAKDVRKEFNEMYGEMANLSRQVGAGMTIAGGAIIGGFTAAAKASSDFNVGLSEISTLVDTSVVSINKLKQGINSLAMETGQSAKDLTGSMYEAISSGVDASNAISFMGVASKAAVAGVTSTQTAVDGLTTAINAFGLKTEDAGMVADSIFQAVMDGKQTFEETSKFMYEGASAAAAAKVSFKELMAASSTLTSAGIPASVAFGRIQAALTGLQRPSKEMDAIFQSLGYKNAQAAVEAKGFVFALDAVKDATHGDNGALITLLGSTEAVAAANILAGTGAKKFADDMKRQEQATGAADAAYKKMASGADAAGKRLKETMGVITRSIGDAVLPAFAALASAVAPVARAFAWLAQTPVGKAMTIAALGVGVLLTAMGPLFVVLPGAVQMWNLLTAAQQRNAKAAAEAAAANVVAGDAAAAGGVGAAAGASGGLLRGAGRMLAPLLAPIGAALAPIGAMLTAAWGAVLPVLVGVGEAIAAIAAAIAALPLGTIALIVAAIAALGIGIWQLVKHWDAVTAWFKSLPATIGGALGSIGGFFSRLGSSVTSGISGAVGSIAEFVTSIPSAVAGGIATAWEAVKSFFAQLPHMAGQAIGLTLGVILWLPTGIKLAAQKIGEGVAAIGAFLASLPAAVASAAQKIGAGFVSIGQWFATLPGLVGGAVMQAWQWLKSLPQMALSAAGALAQSIGEGVQTAWQWLASLPGKAWAAGSEMVRSLGEWFGSLPQRVANWFGGVWDYLKSLPKQWYDSGVAMVQELINGVKSKWGEFVQGIKDGLQRAADMLPHSDPKTGPLKGLQKSGRALAEEFSKGANDGFHRGVLTPGLNTVAGGLNTVIANGASGGTSVDARSNYNITVHAAAGANGQEIGKQIVSELRKVGRDGRFSYAANAGY